jgi:general secretion pathway protein B
LKRLEEKRQGASSSDLLTIQVNTKHKSGQKRLLWPYILSLALLANAGVAAWWVFAKHDTPHQNLPSPSVSKVTPNHTPENVPAPIIAQPPLKTHAPKGADSLSTQAPVRVNQPVVKTGQPVDKAGQPIERTGQAPVKPRSVTSPEGTPSPKGTVPAPVTSANEPAIAQETLPDLKVSLHSYSPDPSARLVRINDKTLKEGESLSPDTKVESITPDGVIVIHQGRRHNLSVRSNP